MYNSAKHPACRDKALEPLHRHSDARRDEGRHEARLHGNSAEETIWGWVNGAFARMASSVKKTEIDGTYKENKSKFAEGFGIRLYFGMNQRPRDSGASNSGLTSPSARRGGIFRKLVSKKRSASSKTDSTSTYLHHTKTHCYGLPVRAWGSSTATPCLRSKMSKLPPRALQGVQPVRRAQYDPKVWRAEQLRTSLL